MEIYTKTFREEDTMKKRLSLLLSVALLASTVTGFAADNSGKTLRVSSANNTFETQVTQGDSTVPNPAKEREDSKDTLTVFMSTLSKEFLPIYNATPNEGQVIHLMFDSLYTNDEKGLTNVPRLAEKYQVSNNNKTITFSLRKNVKWSMASLLQRKM